LPGRLHEALIKRSYEDRLVGHLSRDSTAIEAREKPVKTAAPAPSKRKRGRPKKGEGGIDTKNSSMDQWTGISQ
jgi:hypothetical protein